MVTTQLQNVNDNVVQYIQTLFDDGFLAKGSISEAERFVTEHFEDYLKLAPKDTPQIPSLNVCIEEKDVHGLYGKVVRCRVMIQDVVSQQVVPRCMEQFHQETGSKKTLYIRHFSGVDSLMGEIEQEVVFQENADTLGDQQVVYGISIPGECEWRFKEFHGDRNASKVFDGLGFKEKHPLHLESCLAVVCKIPLEESSEGIKVGDVVEVIGVLTPKHLLPSGPERQVFLIESPSLLLESTLPSIQVIAYQKTKEPSGAAAIVKEDLLQCRQKMLTYFTDCFQGDDLVAEYMLMFLMAKVYSRTHEVPLGSCSLNILDPKDGSNILQTIESILQRLVPMQTTLPISIENLNRAMFSPYHPADDNTSEVGLGLLSGPLQLPATSCVLLDETKMTEGKLNEIGIKNIQAVQGVLTSQNLKYYYPYHEAETTTDLRILSVSSNYGNSIFQMDVHIPLIPGESTHQNISEEDWKMFQSYLLYSRNSEWELPLQVSEFIQQDYVARRKQASETASTLPNEQDLMLELKLCRLLSQSKGEKALSRETYQQVKDLEHRRYERLKSVKSKQQPIAQQLQNMSLNS